MPSAPAPSPPRPAALAFIYVTVLLDMLAFGVAIPVLPFLYEELSGGAASRAAEMAGFFGLAFAAMQLVFGPVLVNLWSLYGPAMQGLLVPRVGPSQQGQLQGALQGLRGLCALATPLLYTQTFARGSAFVAGAPYWLAAGLVGAALLLALRAATPLPVAKLPEMG
jgi:hypothetical protein